MRASDARVARIPQHRIGDAARAELSDARVGPRAHLIEIAEEDRLGRTRLRARRHQAVLLTVVAERAFERAAVNRIFVDDAERAGNNAVAAPVADVGLDVHAPKLCPHDRSGRACLEATGDLALLADVGREFPGNMIAGVAAASPLRRSLDELHMPPGRVAERRGVVVRKTAPRVAVGGNLVPLLARNLA